MRPFADLEEVDALWYTLDHRERDYYYQRGDLLSDRQAYDSWRAPYRNKGSYCSTRMQRKYTFNNYWWRTDTGLKKSDLTQSKTGKVVSKKKSIKGMSNPWILACAAAKEALNLRGFVACKKNSPYYKKAKQLHPKFVDAKEHFEYVAASKLKKKNSDILV